MNSGFPSNPKKALDTCNHHMYATHINHRENQMATSAMKKLMGFFKGTESAKEEKAEKKLILAIG